MKVTIGICTWNRAALLDLALGKMLSLRIPKGLSWEVLVVNNNSTDDTEKVLASYEGRLPLRRFFEAAPGKSNALNLAVREAQGDLIFWTDDDVLVDSEWVAGYAAAAEQWPEAAFFGGPIEPWFEGNPPRWLRQAFPKIEVAFAARNLGAKECFFTGEETLPFGANLAVRTAVQRRYLYDGNLGPLRNNGMRGEETAVLVQMTRDGLEGRWVPGAKVRHFIPKDRQSFRYLRSYYQGAGQVWSQLAGKKKCAKWFGKSRWALRMAIENAVLFGLKRFTCKPESWIENFILANMGWGYFIHPDRADELQRLEE
jgi:glycosyltransferase involved in cell wall biosynthesis